jgi:hypothetical protein
VVSKCITELSDVCVPCLPVDGTSNSHKENNSYRKALD